MKKRPADWLRASVLDSKRAVRMPLGNSAPRFLLHWTCLQIKAATILDRQSFSLRIGKINLPLQRIKSGETSAWELGQCFPCRRPVSCYWRFYSHFTPNAHAPPFQLHLPLSCTENVFGKQHLSMSISNQRQASDLLFFVSSSSCLTGEQNSANEIKIRPLSTFANEFVEHRVQPVYFLRRLAACWGTKSIKQNSQRSIGPKGDQDQLHVLQFPKHFRHANDVTGNFKNGDAGRRGFSHFATRDMQQRIFQLLFFALLALSNENIREVWWMRALLLFPICKWWWFG